MAVLVVEDRPATILRLDGVVADPEAEAVELGAAQRVLRGTLRATGSSWEERVPAVAPDRVLALPWIAVGLVATGVHDLEVVDVVVAFVEVAVAVMVVAVPDVERCKLRSDLGVGPACGLLVRYPLVHRVLDEEPGVRADAAAAGEAVAASVSCLVVADLHPVRDDAVDAVAPGRLLLVVLLQGLVSTAGAEVEPLVVLAVVVRLPNGRVVDRAVLAVGSRCAAVPRTGLAPGDGGAVSWSGYDGCRSVPNSARITKIRSVVSRARLDVLVPVPARSTGRQIGLGCLAHLDDGADTAVDGRGLAVHDLCQGLFAQVAPFCPRAGWVGRRLPRRRLPAGRRWRLEPTRAQPAPHRRSDSGAAQISPAMLLLTPASSLTGDSDARTLGQAGANRDPFTGKFGVSSRHQSRRTMGW